MHNVFERLIVPEEKWPDEPVYDSVNLYWQGVDAMSIADEGHHRMHRIAVGTRRKKGIIWYILEQETKNQWGERNRKPANTHMSINCHPTSNALKSRSIDGPRIDRVTAWSTLLPLDTHAPNYRVSGLRWALLGLEFGEKSREKRVLTVIASIPKSAKSRRIFSILLLLMTGGVYFDQSPSSKIRYVETKVLNINSNVLSV